MSNVIIKESTKGTEKLVFKWIFPYSYGPGLLNKLFIHKYANVFWKIVVTEEMFEVKLLYNVLFWNIDFIFPFQTKIQLDSIRDIKLSGNSLELNIDNGENLFFFCYNGDKIEDLFILLKLYLTDEQQE